MVTRCRFPFDNLAPLFAVVLAISACGDDDPAGGGNVDTTPPAVSSVTPVDVNHVEVTFNENVQRTSAEDAGNYTIVEATPLVAAGASEAPGDTLYLAALALKSDQRTVSITTAMGAVPYDIGISGVKDASGNAIQTPVVTTFTGTIDPDVTPPAIAYSNPADLATNVPLDTDILITFSEPMSQVSQYEDIALFPYTDGDVEWLDPGTTLRFALYEPLLDDQQYSLTIYPDGLHDLSGNALAPVSIRFTTGNTTARGGIAGTLRGDSESDYADDPTGAFVFVLTTDYELIAGTVAAGNDSYRVQYLPDGEYRVGAILDTNDDGVIDVNRGDAFGFFGTNPRVGDYDEDLVTVSGGNRVTGVNFGLFDSSMITGEVWYEGTHAEEYHDLYIGLFDTNGYDPLSEPDYSTYAPWPSFHQFWFDSYYNGPSDGTFYIGAFLDANDNLAYDPAEDPAAFYDDPSMEITVDNGSDVNDIFIYLEDPLPGRAAPAVAWPAQTPERNAWREKAFAALQKIGREQKTGSTPTTRRPFRD